MARPPARTQSSLLVGVAGVSVAGKPWTHAKIRTNGRAISSKTRTSDPAHSDNRSIGVRLLTSWIKIQATTAYTAATR